MLNILVTCAGSGVGQSAIDSLCQIRRDRIIGCDMNRNVYAFHYCDAFYTVPGLFSDNYLDSILQICIKESVNIVIPGHDHELLLFSSNISKFTDEGIEVIVSLPDLIQVSRDKYVWYKYFKEYGCPVVPTFRVSEFMENPDFSVFPAIVKPSAGSASQGISIINSFEELAKVNREDIIQPYLFPLESDPNYGNIRKAVREGKFIQMSEISIQLIFTKDSKFAGIFISKNTLKNGVPVLVEPILPEDFEFLDDIMKFVPVCINHKVKGPVNIQGRITAKGLICFEMNMRFTGITGNRSQFGFNEVVFLVNNFLGKETNLIGYTSNKLGVRQVACTTIFNKKSEEKTITILGGGHIGTHFIFELLKDDSYRNIYLITREVSFEKYDKLFESSRITIVQNKNDFLVESILSKSDFVINFIGALANKSEKETYESILYLQQFISKIVKAKVPIVVNVSSQSVYDQTINIIKKENEDICINNLYGFQKYLSEVLFQDIKEYNPSAQVMSLRLARVIDTKSTTGFFVESINSLLEEKPVKIPFPNNKINLIDMRDVSSCIKFIIENASKTDFPSVLNIGNENISILDYFKKINDIIPNIIFELLEINDNNAVGESSLISSDAIRERGWTPQYTISNMIEEIIKYIRNEREENV